MSRSPVPKRKWTEAALPLNCRNELSHILIPAEPLERRIRQLAKCIQDDFGKKDLVIVALLNGTVLFLADLIRYLDLSVSLDFIGVSSYHGDTAPTKMVFTKHLRLDIRGRDVLVVDDIVDTGRTLSSVFKNLRQFKPRRLKSCVLLDKAARREVNIQPDYVGFRIPDVFVVGYGLDYAERYRNLPFVGVLKPEIYQDSSSGSTYPDRVRRRQPVRKASV